ncbi:MAG: HAMP domain-containing protein [Bacteroidetes bacterium]|nr:MAG: HAMP domain-containing protein [Bacteroidota bacterium]
MYEERYGARIHVRHILIAPRVDPTAGPEEREAARRAALEKARRLVERIRAGEEFAELARRYSDDPETARRGGDLGRPMGRHELVESFAEAAFALKPGEVSDPVESEFGFHIIQVTRIDPPKRPFEEVRAELERARNEPITDEEVQRLIDRLSDIPDSRLVTIARRAYYQIRLERDVQTEVRLVPLYVSYEVNNEFLVPYLFLGRWRDALYDGGSSRNVRRILVTVGPTEQQGDLQLLDPEGGLLLTLRNVPVEPFRRPMRLAVMLFFLLSLVGITVFLRIYVLTHWRYRYRLNLGLFLGVIVLRWALHTLGLPGHYIQADLFSPDILAFHVLAPSLGELTLNIFTLGILLWIVYTHFFRITHWLAHYVMERPVLLWPSLGLSLLLSSALLKWYVYVFEQFYVNSQVDIEFSNIFRTDIYSFLILLDVGVLLLALILVVFLLIKLNVLLVWRHQLSLRLLLPQLLFLVAVNLLLHPGAPVLGLLVSLTLATMGLVLYRIPFRPILHHDLGNYLLILLAFSVLVTYNVVAGVNLTRQFRAEQLAQTVLGTQAANTAADMVGALGRIEENMDEIRTQAATYRDINDFRDWMAERFFGPGFKEFQVGLYIYSSAGRRLDSRGEREPTLGPDKGIPLSARGERVSDDVPLYQVVNQENKYIDIYVGEFSLFLKDDSVEQTRFLLELVPNRRETEGLYPSLSLDQKVYDEIRLINAFDHAVYREGILYNKRGESAFPIFMEDYASFQENTHRVRDGWQEYLEPIGSNKLVVVRYHRQSFFEVITSFSFIFYFYVLATLLVIGLPVLGLRSLRSRQFSYQFPLRAKIRFGLLAISILPMLVIIILLYPFVTSRYSEDARKELSEEAARIAEVIGPEFQRIRNDPFARLTLSQGFRDRVASLADYMTNDVNVYDEFGKRVASTQTMIFENGIQTDLMHAVAFDSLRNGGLSDLVIREKIGTLAYLSGYRPIIGNNNTPIGYVNVPYIARQDQLEEQVLNFLAYLANIYLLAFLLLNLVAVVVSGTITRPLSMIQQRLSATNLGNVNEPIEYTAKDEIGAIVAAYNQMVAQLAESEEKLSQTQREQAWRQMARQVAHEIKNPLTPMKLSIQHLMRAQKEGGPHFEKMFEKVMKTLMVQIESMVRIANSFSEFAKMPEPVKGQVNVTAVLMEVVDLYTQSEEALWLIDVPQAPFWAVGDRDQLSRCFNNVIKNALQAVEEDGIIKISMEDLRDRAHIEIKDNGKGIPAELGNRVFEPSFSTKTSGMGLGLAIVKRIIDGMGGTITFRSQEGEGTVFIIEIPAEEVERLQPLEPV